MPTLRRFSASDPQVQELLGSAHQRQQHLLQEADAKARHFYREKLGEELSIEEAVARIFAEVDGEGDAAVVRYNQAFDGSQLTAAELRVPETEIAAAWDRIPAELQSALKLATDQITSYQRSLLPTSSQQWQDLDVRWTPLERVGAYVPGGTGGSLPLCSTVLMNLLPAVVAGVRECVLVTPPRPDGSVADEILAACHVAGVKEVYRCGGVQAIAAMACGTEAISRVDKIVGPGNIAVTMAKRHAYGRVDIDMLAGPSEVLVLADASCKPDWIAADLLSQAEHDSIAMAVLLSTDPDSTAAIMQAVEQQLAELPDERRQVAEASIANLGTAIDCASLDEAIALCDRFAPEHLEILTANAEAVAKRIHHAGAIFIGPWSPEPIGDYVAGPSHTLPTGGTARMWSGIGADTFLKRSSIIRLDEAGFKRLATAGITLAEAEGLTAHARSLKIRLDADHGQTES